MQQINRNATKTEESSTSETVIMHCYLSLLYEQFLTMSVHDKGISEKGLGSKYT
jgi:hypothetical protein